jgi:tRNA threonylcarbamoyladenosine biosynthesis protein TsaE
MSVTDHRAILGSTAWGTEADTQAFAQKLAQALLSGPQPLNVLIELHGQLGAGKTTLARHLLRALGVSGRIKSPTYGVLESYQAMVQGQPLALSHLDFYRFNDPDEWEDAGFRDLFANPGLKLVEWPERVAGQLPPADLQIFIESLASVGDEDAPRQVRLQAGTPLGQSLMETLA